MKKIGWVVVVLLALAAALFIFHKLHTRGPQPTIGPIPEARLTHDAVTALMTNQLPMTKTGKTSAPRFTIQKNTNCVTDNLTGLIWARNANIASILIYRDTTGKVTWAEAVNVITNAQGLNGTSYGGYTDWRLPNIKELHTLVEGQASGPALSNKAMTDTPFTDIQSDYYWSSTFYADTTDGAWGMNLVNGSIGSVNRAGPYYLLPVRGGQ